MHKIRPAAMISSISRDLPDHRKQVMYACHCCAFDYVWMETLPGSDGGAVNGSMDLIDQADIYLGIFADRYGFVPVGSEISVTEMEYQRAFSRGIPCLIFLIHDEHVVTKIMVETGPEAEKLKRRLVANHVVAYFKSADDLRGHVLHALPKALKKLIAPEPSPIVQPMLRSTREMDWAVSPVTIRRNVGRSNGWPNGDQVGVDIFIDWDDFDTWNDQQKQLLLDAIGKLLEVKGGIKVIKIRKGSNVLTVCFSREQAERLQRAVDQGLLNEFHAKHAELIAHGETEDASVGLDGGFILADVSDVSIDAVFDELKREKEIWSRSTAMFNLSSKDRRRLVERILVHVDARQMREFNVNVVVSLGSG